MSSRVPISACLALIAVVLLIGVPGFSQQTKSSAPSKSKSPLAAAKLQFAKHDLKSAEDSLWAILSSDPNNSEALLLLGMVRGEQQRYPEAEALFQRAGQLDPRSAQARVFLGKIYLTENKIPEATEQ